MYNDTKQIHYEIDISKPNETIEQKLKRICLLIVNKNNYAVGIEFTCGKPDPPVLILKTLSVNWIKKLCKENNISIVYNKKIAAHLFFKTEEYTMIPMKMWQKIADIFAEIIESNNEYFINKIKYKADE